MTKIKLFDNECGHEHHTENITSSEKLKEIERYKENWIFVNL